MHALGLEFGSAAQLSKRPGSVLNCLWGNALKRSPGIIRKSRVSYPGPGFLSSATWPSLPKKHYKGLNQTKPRVEIRLILNSGLSREVGLLPYDHSKGVHSISVLFTNVDQAPASLNILSSFL